ncbi:hypothetical protein BTJ68_03057 [Hortaea werneckii EXF-2000]|uniref:Zn(2)-C6 fungal-type domain-containing protein n=2 Tax=Hortaea werneckii TaxID=91943 RepID=A0A3M7JET5_HORWE|nr:hypothetical protein BTJ68_03057 [Hortaea werneckii EXF-2000]RMZ35656.1 hypothetical protein D0859_00167 [Hortaea werneckii]
MSPLPFSPLKMPQNPRTSSSDSTDAIRKRVCKACDRCRLKKSKCDGSSPCSRCKADNAICVFGERKKSHDKIYPKGYVEMLEQQQGQLVSGLQEMYRRLLNAQAWTGPKLEETEGNPLTHDILKALNLLETKHDGSGDVEMFEEDCSKLQSKLVAEGAGYAHRRGSVSSDSEHSQQNGHSRSASHNNVPTRFEPFRESFNFGTTSSPSPRLQSPVQRSRPTFPPAQPSPLQQSSPLMADDPQFYQPEWAIPDMSNPEMIMRSKFAARAPLMQENMEAQMQAIFDNTMYDSSMTWDDSNGAAFSQQFSQQYGNPGPQDFGPIDYSQDVEFNNFVSVQT